MMPPVSEVARIPAAGIVLMILAAHMLAGTAKQLQGYELYTGEDAQIRAISRLVHFSKPSAPRLGESIITLEVPNIRAAEFGTLAEAKEKLKELREAFAVEMGALTADLEAVEWNADVIEELRLRKKAKVDPILFDLRRKAASTLENMLKGHAHEGLAASLGVGSFAMNIAMALGANLNLTLLAAVLGTEAGILAGAFAQALNNKAEIDKNHLGYVIRLEDEFKKASAIG
jgi:hypothetical protein